MFGTIEKLDKQAFQYVFALSEHREWLLLAGKSHKPEMAHSTSY